MSSFFKNFDAYQPNDVGLPGTKEEGCRNRMATIIVGTVGFFLTTGILSRILVAGGSSDDFGVNAQQYQDGTTHVTAYRPGQEGSKGERISFDHNPQDGNVKGVHYTNQDTRTYSRGGDAIDDWSK